MSEFTSDQLYRHHRFAWILLILAGIVWLAASWAFRTRVGIPEYLMALLGISGILAFTAAVLRISVWIKQRTTPGAAGAMTPMALVWDIVFFVAALTLVCQQILFPWLQFLQTR